MVPHCGARLSSRQSQPGPLQAEVRRAAGRVGLNSEAQNTGQAEPFLPTHERGAAEPLERGMEPKDGRGRRPGAAGDPHHQAAAVPGGAAVPATPQPGGPGDPGETATPLDPNSTDDAKVQWSEYLQTERSGRPPRPCPVCREKEAGQLGGAGLLGGSHLPRPLPGLVSILHSPWIQRIVRWIARNFNASGAGNPIESAPLHHVRPGVHHHHVSNRADRTN